MKTYISGFIVFWQLPIFPNWYTILNNYIKKSRPEEKMKFWIILECLKKYYEKLRQFFEPLSLLLLFTTGDFFKVYGLCCGSTSDGFFSSTYDSGTQRCMEYMDNGCI